MTTGSRALPCFEEATFQNMQKSSTEYNHYRGFRRDTKARLILLWRTRSNLYDRPEQSQGADSSECSAGHSRFTKARKLLDAAERPPAPKERFQFVTFARSQTRSPHIICHFVQKQNSVTTKGFKKINFRKFVPSCFLAIK